MTERHTRQGMCRGQWGWSAQRIREGQDDDRDRPAVKDPRGGSKAELRAIAGWGCWCGLSNGHDWPGKTEGAPHPR